MLRHCYWHSYETIKQKNSLLKQNNDSSIKNLTHQAHQSSSEDINYSTNESENPVTINQPL